MRCQGSTARQIQWLLLCCLPTGLVERQQATAHGGSLHGGPVQCHVLWPSPLSEGEWASGREGGKGVVCLCRPVPPVAVCTQEVAAAETGGNRCSSGGWSYASLAPTQTMHLAHVVTVRKKVVTMRDKGSNCEEKGSECRECCSRGA